MHARTASPVFDLLDTPGSQLKQSGVPDELQVPGPVTDLRKDEIAAVRLADQFTIGIDIPEDLRSDSYEAFVVDEPKQSRQQKDSSEPADSSAASSQAEKTDESAPDSTASDTAKSQKGRLVSVEKVRVCGLLKDLGSTSHFVPSSMKIKTKHNNRPRLYLTFSRNRRGEQISENQAAIIKRLFCDGLYKTAKLSVFFDAYEFDFAIINLYAFEEGLDPEHRFRLEHDRLSLLSLSDDL